jgi:hypothetical protein
MGFLYSYLTAVDLVTILFTFEYQSFDIDEYTFEPKLSEQSKSRHHDSAIARRDHRGCQTGQRYDDQARSYQSDNIEQIHQMVNVHCPNFSGLPI